LPFAKVNFNTKSMAKKGKFIQLPDPEILFIAAVELAGEIE